MATHPETKRAVGRPSSASREKVTAAALRHYLHGERIDLHSIAGELGVSRTSIYRWFGSREALIGEILVLTAEPLVVSARREAGGSGAERLLDFFDGLNRRLVAAPALRRFVERERDAAVRIITDGNGAVQQHMVGWIAEAIEEEVEAGSFDPPLPAGELAYAIVRLAEAFLFIDATAGLVGDVGRLRSVEAALLGLPAAARTEPPAA